MTPSDRVRVREVREARERVLQDICPECGHSAGWHGENHDDGCEASNDCPCSLNARDCHAKIDKSAALDAYAEAIRAERAAEIAALKADRDHLNEMYVSLLNEVAVKIPNETRYETARRYIREREAQHEAGDAARASEPRGSNG